MIRAIVAIDEKRGIANDHTIPWLGKIPSDTKYYRQQVRGATVIMGSRQYHELRTPYQDAKNIVASKDASLHLRSGFELLNDVRGYMKNAKDDVWNLGGAILYESTFDLIQEIYITQLVGDFNCTKFFPEYQRDFTLIDESNPITENGITFTFQKWIRKA